MLNNKTLVTLMIIVIISYEIMAQRTTATFSVQFVTIMNGKIADTRCCVGSNKVICTYQSCNLTMEFQYNTVKMNKHYSTVQVTYNEWQVGFPVTDGTSRIYVTLIASHSSRGYLYNVFSESFTAQLANFKRFYGGILSSERNSAFSYSTYSSCSKGVGPSCIDCTPGANEVCNLITGIKSCSNPLYNPRNCSLKYSNVMYQCSSHGFLQIQDGFTSCRCSNGYNGTTCSIRKCDSSSCVEGTCIYNSQRNMNECYCKEGYNGLNCETASCNSNYCLNEGTCRVQNNRLLCSCSEGYNGQRCQFISCLNNCNNRGTCVTNSTTGNSMCSCEKNYAGIDCSIQICNSQTCVNGSCSNFNGQSPNDICVCDYGFTGPNCNITICWPEFCNNRGTCSYQNNQALCSCQNGFSGRFCQNVDCPFGCVHGECKNVIHERPKECVCKTGWTGSSCNERVCYGNCKNGTCQIVDTKNICVCNNGYRGMDCDVPYCPNGLCKNGGRCYYDNNQFGCTCLAGYKGLRCEKEIVCLHGGLLNNQQCICGEGYEGENCEKMICYSGYCKNGGTCSVDKNSRHCQCPGEYNGYLCEFTNTKI